MSEKIKFAVIGVSGRGSGMALELQSVEGVEIVAVCDLYQDRVDDMIKRFDEECGFRPDGYTDYKEMIKREDIGAVMISTTWITHSRIAVDCMKAGKHVGMEVGGAASIEECWELVRTSEETGKFCMLLENCCYDRFEMALFNMKCQGLFGEVVHTQGAYQHDLRDEIVLGRENRHGRLYNFMNRDGEVYPTHQLGPICKLLDINRGNRMVSVVSMSSKARGLNQWIKDNKGEDYDLYGYDFTLGDVVTTMIKCAHGETILLTHECSLPRPYSRGYRIDGTKGMYTEDDNQIYIEGRSPQHEFERVEPYIEEFEHPLWKEYFQKGVHEAGHGGMDFLVLSAFAEAALNDTKPPIDVYDTAAWMAVTCLSEQSIATGSHPIAFPDFTNGMWIDREPYRRGRYCLDEICPEYYDIKEESKEDKAE